MGKHNNANRRPSDGHVLPRHDLFCGCLMRGESQNAKKSQSAKQNAKAGKETNQAFLCGWEESVEESSGEDESQGTRETLS